MCKFIKEINYKINIAWGHWLTSKLRCFSPNCTNTSVTLWNIWSKTLFNNPSSVSLEIKSSTSIVNLLLLVPTYLNSNSSALVSILVNLPKPESSDSVYPVLILWPNILNTKSGSKLEDKCPSFMETMLSKHILQEWQKISLNMLLFVSTTLTTFLSDSELPPEEPFKPKISSQLPLLFSIKLILENISEHKTID